MSVNLGRRTLVNRTCARLADELAFDASLLRALDVTGTGETLRVWESAMPAVVLGHGGRIDADAHAAACAADGVPIVRRVTGGGAVVVAAGCLNVSLVLSLDARPELRDVANSYEVILGTIVTALGVPGLAHRGLSDLAIGDRKVSGNAQRRGRRALLHQGTLLYACDVRLFSRYLTEPSRQPAYRAGRSHDAFVANLPLSAGDIRERLFSAFAAPPWLIDAPMAPRPDAGLAPPSDRALAR